MKHPSVLADRGYYAGTPRCWPASGTGSVRALRAEVSDVKRQGRWRFGKQDFVYVPRKRTPIVARLAKS